MTTEVRTASPADARIWRALRRDGIARFPSAFIPSLAEHDAIPLAQDADRLAQGDRFLAFQGKRPVGLIGMNRHAGRSSHRGEIGPLYVIPDAQGTGVAQKLLRAVLEYADRVGIWQPELYVNEENRRAIAIYEKHGFVRVGRVPNAIMGANGPEHDLMMILTSAARAT